MTLRTPTIRYPLPFTHPRVSFNWTAIAQSDLQIAELLRDGFIFNTNADTKIISLDPYKRKPVSDEASSDFGRYKAELEATYGPDNVRTSKGYDMDRRLVEDLKGLWIRKTTK